MDSAQQPTSQKGNSFYTKFQVAPPIVKETVDLSYQHSPKECTLSLQQLLDFKFSNEYRGLINLTDTEMHDANMYKPAGTDKLNRYCNIIPYKQTAVTLQVGKSDAEKYVNANYISTNFGPKTFIATQGPLPASIVQFWWMVFEQNSELIVMLCKEYEQDRLKCDRYWPKKGEIIRLGGDLSVTSVIETRNAKENITTRVLALTQGAKTRNVTQIHWEGWPDHGVPNQSDYPVLEQLVQLVANQVEQSLIPIVHCSAGVGRTGTLLALTHIYMNLKNHQSKGTPTRDIRLNVFDIVRRLREQRTTMVQTQDQLELVYRMTQQFIRQLFK